MSSAPTAEEISRDATWLAQALDPTAGVVRLVAMDKDSYHAASFLDDRLMQQAVDAHVVPWPEIEAAVDADLRTDARWIFHIGHVGSTLVSRLLGGLDNVLAIREPRLLRDLAVSPPEVHERYVPAIPKLMSRTFAKEEIACVKVTSFGSELAPQLVQPSARALFIYARPRNYVASILAGENSVKELHSLGEFRRQRLAKRGITFPAPRHDADRAVVAWACEMATIEADAEIMIDRQISWADFDSVLANLSGELVRIADFFGFTAPREQVAAITQGPLMKRYSKDTRYEYSPRLRQDLIDQEIGLQGGDIDAALAMLRSASETSPLLGRALARVEGF